MSRSQRICLVLLFCASAALRAQEPEVERDDPAARLRELTLQRGTQPPAQRWRVLQEAARERDHYGTTAAAAQPSLAPSRNALTLQPVQGGTFISLGPSGSDYAYNGAKYFEVDSGRARQVVAHPVDPAILYLASAGGGVWKTWDAGAHWEPITDQLGTTAIGTLAMDPMNPDILYLGFGDPFDVHQPGLVRSSDGGATWSAPVQLVGASQRVAASVTDIKVDPANSAVVLAATDVGLFRSGDAGASWQQIALSGPAGAFFYMWSIAYAGGGVWLASGQLADPAKPVSVLSNTGQLGLWRSVDDGVTWTYATSALPGGEATAITAGRGTLVVAPSTLIDPATSRIFLLAASVKGSAQLDLYRSDDGGNSFDALGMNAGGAPANPNPDQQDLNVLSEQAWYNQAIAVDPEDPDLVFVGGELSLVRSQDGGNTWAVVSDWLPGPQRLSLGYVHADLHALALGADGVLYAGSDGGIFASKDARAATAGNVTFSSTQNRGLVTHLVYTVACAPEAWPAEMQAWVAGGMQDNGTRVRSGATTIFNQVLGGDGIGLAVSAGTHFDNALAAGVPDVILASAEFKLFRSVDGGQSWASFTAGMGSAQLGFFVRVARDVASPDPQVFITYTATPAAMYRSASNAPWSDISGTLHWQNGTGDTTGFVTKDGSAIGLRNVATHPLRAGVYGAQSNKFVYVTPDGGINWFVSTQPAPSGVAEGAGAYLLSSMAFDPADASGRTYYVTSRAMDLADVKGGTLPLPESFGHLYKTSDGGATWTSLGTQPLGSGGLPFVPFEVVAVDPNSSTTLYVGTALGLYRSSDGGAHWERLGAGSLPLVEVTDVCISPASRRLTVATYGRGFWQIGTDASTNAAGVKGNGDTNFDQRIDGLDLIDLADAFGTTQASDQYRWQADLVGAVNAIDGDDLAALLARFGGSP